jgi:hypothetical protein
VIPTQEDFQRDIEDRVRGAVHATTIQGREATLYALTRGGDKALLATKTELRRTRGITQVSEVLTRAHRGPGELAPWPLLEESITIRFRNEVTDALCWSAPKVGFCR